MRKVIVFILAVILLSSPVMAQGDARSSESKRSSGMKKIFIGVGALALGTLLVAKSSDTSSGRSVLSTSQLATGLVIGGVGGFLLWNGLDQRRDASASTLVGISASKQSRAVFVRKRW